MFGFGELPDIPEDLSLNQRQELYQLQMDLAEQKRCMHEEDSLMHEEKSFTHGERRNKSYVRDSQHMLQFQRKLDEFQG